MLRGRMGKKQRQIVAERLAAIPRDEPLVLLATGKFVGEGFDDARLDTLFLTLPVSWRGTAAQYAGRLHRLYDGKREVRIYDYADLDVPMLARMFDSILRAVSHGAPAPTKLLTIVNPSVDKGKRFESLPPSLNRSHSSRFWGIVARGVSPANL